VKIYDLAPPFEVEISICAQKSDGVWVEILYYALHGGDLVEQLQTQSNNLLKAWNCAAGKTLPS
jgi:hypothetical protein